MTIFSTAALAQWVVEVPPMAANIRRAAMLTFADTIAAARQGSTSDAALFAFTALQESKGSCTIIGRPSKLTAPAAALVNGTAAHALEIDDNFLVAGTHGSAALVPALLALGETFNSDGAAILDAFVIGLQVEWRLAHFLHPEHGDMGWHPTATIGAMGCAAACARTLRLSVDQTICAIGLSSSMAGGTNAQFGYHAKPVHAGLAAHAGVLSAMLARSGITAAPDALEATNGYIQAASGSPRRDADFTAYGTPLALLEHGVAMKVWPSCGSTHPAIHAALLASEGLDPNHIDHIRVTIPTLLNDNLTYRIPVNADQAKFSLEFTVAVAVADRTLTFDTLDSVRWQDSEIESLMAKIERVVIPNDFADFKITVEIILGDGTTRSTESSFDKLPGTNKHPLAEKDFIARLQRSDDADGQGLRLWSAIHNMANGSVRALAAHLA